MRRRTPSARRRSRLTACHTRDRPARDGRAAAGTAADGEGIPGGRGDGDAYLGPALRHPGRLGRGAGRTLRAPAAEAVALRVRSGSRPGASAAAGADADGPPVSSGADEPDQPPARCAHAVHRAQAPREHGRLPAVLGRSVRSGGIPILCGDQGHRVARHGQMVSSRASPWSGGTGCHSIARWTCTPRSKRAGGRTRGEPGRWSR